LLEAKKFLNPIQIARNKRNKKILAKLNNLIKNYGMKEIDFKKRFTIFPRQKKAGVLPNVIFFMPLLKKLLQKTGKREKLISFFKR